MLIPFLRAKFREFIRNESGATAIEYALIAALLSLAIIVTVTLVGTNLGVVFQRIADALVPPT